MLLRYTLTQYFEWFSSNRWVCWSPLQTHFCFDCCLHRSRWFRWFRSWFSLIFHEGLIVLVHIARYESLSPFCRWVGRFFKWALRRTTAPGSWAPLEGCFHPLSSRLYPSFCADSTAFFYPFPSNITIIYYPNSVTENIHFLSCWDHQNVVFCIW